MTVDDLVAPLFVREGIRRTGAHLLVARDRASTRWRRSSSRPSDWPPWACRRWSSSACPATKDATGSGAWDPDGIVQVALSELRAAVGDAMVLIADLCLDEYTDHGHCGVVRADGSVDNDATLDAVPTGGAGAGGGRAPTSSPPAG